MYHYAARCTSQHATERGRKAYPFRLNVHFVPHVSIITSIVVVSMYIYLDNADMEKDCGWIATSLFQELHMIQDIQGVRIYIESISSRKKVKMPPELLRKSWFEVRNIRTSEHLVEICLTNLTLRTLSDNITPTSIQACHNLLFDSYRLCHVMSAKGDHL
jgi:hypothetical protein